MRLTKFNNITISHNNNIMYLCITKQLNNKCKMLRIKEIMKSKGINTVDLAVMLNVSRETVSRQINESNMTIATLQRYADVLNVQVVDLFEQEGSKQSNIICPHCKQEMVIKIDS